MVVDGQKQVWRQNQSGKNRLANPDGSHCASFLPFFWQIREYTWTIRCLTDTGKTCHNFLRKGPDRNLKPSRSEATVLSIYLFIARQAAVVFMAWTDTLHVWHTALLTMKRRHNISWTAYQKVRWRGVKARAKTDTGVLARSEHLDLQQVLRHLLLLHWINLLALHIWQHPLAVIFFFFSIRCYTRSQGCLSITPDLLISFTERHRRPSAASSN